MDIIFVRLNFACIYFRACKFCNILRGFIFAYVEILILLRGPIFMVTRY